MFLETGLVATTMLGRVSVDLDEDLAPTVVWGRKLLEAKVLLEVLETGSSCVDEWSDASVGSEDAAC